jgi:hypothetical protein
VVAVDQDELEAQPPQPEPEDRTPETPVIEETVLVRQIRYFVAICSFAAGVLHILAMIDHDHHPAAARAFLFVAMIQIVWGALLLIDPNKIVVAVGAALTVGAIVAWVFTRTKGISWFPGLELPEPIEWRDTVTQLFQMLAVAGAVILLLPASVHKPAGKRIELIPIALMIVFTLGTLGILYAATHDYEHHDHQPGSADEGHTH